MAGKAYKVKCLDAKYDEHEGFLVLNLYFFELEEKRIVTPHKSDFTYKGQAEVPDIEMHRTATMMKGKTFNWVIEDDPNRHHLTESQQMEYASVFNKKITEELGKVTEGLADDEGQIARKLHRMGEEGKLDFAKMYEKESNLRNRLGL